MACQRKLKMSDEVRDLIRHLHPDIKHKVRMALSEIIENPSRGKSLCGELQGMRSFRMSKLCIIHRSAAQVIEVIMPGARRSIYEETLRLLQTEKPKGIS